jgi:hypothetical protein
MPNKSFEILPNGKTCTIIFYDNIKYNPVIDGMTGKSLPSWDYEKYNITVNYNTNLLAQIESDYSTWLKKAKNLEKEIESNKIRDYRDSLLNQCDLQHCNPEKWTAMSDDEKLSWANYKQALIDISTQDGFPYTVNWPTIPSDTTNTVESTLASNKLVGQQIASLSLSDAEKTNLISQLGSQLVQAQLNIASLKGSATT